MELVVLDLASLSFGLSPDGATLSARTNERVLLASVTVDRPGGGKVEADKTSVSSERAEDVLRLLDVVLAQARLQSAGGARVALLNPHSGEVAVGPLPATRVFSAPKLKVPADGVRAEIRDGMLVLDGGISCPPAPGGFAATFAALAAHRR